MTDDAALLRRYASDQSEDAFAEFVRRNLPFVFAAATRRLGGDTHRAADVAQSVFCAAARNAQKLAGHPTVAGWLYTATRHAASDLRRTEGRRQAREQEVYRMQQDLSKSEPVADPAALRAVLDPAMDELNDADREAVLLRFFQERSFAEIGVALGLSADSARKRVDRALDKLGGLLQSRGIASSGAALATVLATQTAVAVPPTLATSITSVALGSGTAATGTAAALGLTKLQVAVVSLVVAGVAAGIYHQQQNIAALPEGGAAKEHSVAAMPSPVTTPESATVASAPTSTPAAPAQPLPPAFTLPVPTARQRSDMHHRYDPMFRHLGFTAEQEEKFIALKLWQFEINRDLQEAVRANGLNGSSPGVNQLRARVSEPVGRELRSLLGPEGMAYYGRYEVSSGYRISYLEPMNAYLNRAAVPLSEAQAGQMLEAFTVHQRKEQARPTDISTTVSMDWDGVAAQAAGILTPEQLVQLKTYIADQTKKRGPH